MKKVLFIFIVSVIVISFSLIVTHYYYEKEETGSRIQSMTSFSLAPYKAAYIAKNGEIKTFKIWQGVVYFDKEIESYDEREELVKSKFLSSPDNSHEKINLVLLGSYPEETSDGRWLQPFLIFIEDND